MGHREQDVCADIIWSTDEGKRVMEPKIEYRVERSQPPESWTRVRARVGEESAQTDLKWEAREGAIEEAKAQLAATYGIAKRAAKPRRSAHAPQEAEEGSE